jgi:hypothetical protein
MYFYKLLQLKIQEDIYLSKFVHILLIILLKYLMILLNKGNVIHKS